MDTERDRRAGPTDRPSLDGLEEKWARRGQEEGTYAFDCAKERPDVFAIDTPPPTVSGFLHIGQLELLRQAVDDLGAAGHIGKLDLLADRAGELVLTCAF